jgi:acetyl-CoA synthetase (ADP-forming)
MIEKALREGRKNLDEFESKELLRSYGIPVVKEIPCGDEASVLKACAEIGRPVVIKSLSAKITHKTERGLVKTGVTDAAQASAAFREIREKCGADFERVLVQRQIESRRELVAGLTTDPQFGPVVMFGLGGIFTEVLKDASFRVAPITEGDALEMMGEIRARGILDAVRGMPPADRRVLASLLVATGRIGVENPEVREIDINPIMLDGAEPVAVDALVVLK